MQKLDLKRKRTLTYMKEFFLGGGDHREVEGGKKRVWGDI
jgi:hypothetical protein